MFDENYQSKYEYAEVSWAGGLRKGQLDEFAQAVHRLSPYCWKAASEANGFIAGNNTLVGYGLEYKNEFKAYPVKHGPRTVVIRRRPQTPLILQCFPRVCPDALTVDFYTLGGRDLGQPATFRCEEVGFHKLEQKARRRALRVELLKSPLQPIRLVVQGSTLAPTSSSLLWSREIRMGASARRLRTKTDMAPRNLLRALLGSFRHVARPTFVAAKLSKGVRAYPRSKKTRVTSERAAQAQSHLPQQSLQSFQDPYRGERPATSISTEGWKVVPRRR